MAKRFFKYSTDFKSYVIVDDGVNTAASSVSRSDKFDLEDGIQAAILRSYAGLDHPTVPVHALDDQEVNGMAWVDEIVAHGMAIGAKAVISMLKVATGKPSVWKAVDIVSPLIPVNNSYSKLVAFLNK